jgi:hypothetical protein
VKLILLLNSNDIQYLTIVEIFYPYILQWLQKVIELGRPCIPRHLRHCKL